MLGLGFWAALGLSACIEAAAGPPPIAIVIDDLGYQPHNDRAVTEIAALESFAILPFTPHGRALGERLHAAGKEVLLHLPMEAHSRNDLLGPGALRLTMTEGEFRATAHAALAAIPHLAGVNNHMGSLLTAEPERMRWLMSVLADYPALYFIDSRTTAASAARGAASAAAVPYLARDVFLDHERDIEAIHARLDDLVRHAGRRGDAIGIAHPYAETLAVLRARLPGLTAARLVSIRELYELRACRAALAARTSLATPIAHGQRGRQQTEAAADPDTHRQRAE
ncbi:MAG: divergent polysaccharide deacetylase family protein [Gammaproteobacteria bacterium]